MADVNFNCPKCGQNLDAPDDLIGLFVECPACSTVIKVPHSGGDVESAPRNSSSEASSSAPGKGSDSNKDEKGSTMRIELPPGLDIPEPRHRKIFIKRPGK